MEEQTSGFAQIMDCVHFLLLSDVMAPSAYAPGAFLQPYTLPKKFEKELQSVKEEKKMNGFFTAVKENASFVGVCLVTVLAITLIAYGIEKAGRGPDPLDQKDRHDRYVRSDFRNPLLL